MYSAEEYADQHRKFLEENNPSVLHGLKDPNSYLSSVGQTAAERLEHIMSLHLRDPDLQKLSAPQRARELRSRQLEADEMVRHDLIYQPLPE